MLKMLLTSYIALVAIVFLISDWVMFQPPDASKHKISSDLIFLNSESGKKIAALYLKAPEAKHTILFSHGNAEDLVSIRSFLESAQRHGYSIFAYDYQGYGASEGSPHEKNTYQAITAAYNYLTQTLKIPPQQIILYGRSLGAGPTIELATQVPVQGVILESPFVSAYRVVTQIPFFLFDKFKNIQKVGKIKAPVLVLQGTKDEVVPFWQGKKIYAAIKSPKQAFWVEGAGHNDIIYVAQDGYWNAIKHFTDSLEPRHD